MAVPQARAKLGTAPLKQVRRAVSLHLHPPLPRLAKLSPGSFPVMGSRGRGEWKVHPKFQLSEGSQSE